MKISQCVCVCVCLYDAAKILRRHCKLGEKNTLLIMTRWSAEVLEQTAESSVLWLRL